MGAANMGIVFKIYQVYNDRPINWKGHPENIIVWDYTNKAICYHQNSLPWVCNPVHINLIQNNWATGHIYVASSLEALVLVMDFQSHELCTKGHYEEEIP